MSSSDDGPTISTMSTVKNTVLGDYDPATLFLFVPRTVTVLFVGLGVLVWFSGALQSPPPNEADYNSGVWAMIAVYLGYSALQGPSSAMIRPHPVMWKVVHGIAMCYLMFLVFLLMQGKDEARQFMKNIDPSLGEELPERAYGGECRLYIPGEGWHFQTLKETLFDEFVVAHTLGWWAKALIMRNYWMLWTCSIGFELMELTFQHWLLNFNECWWDSWILDVAVCNLAGLLLGMATVKYFGSKRYNWQGISKEKGLFNKTRRGLLQFTPYSFEIWNWGAFSSPRRFLEALACVVAVLICELNAFALKTLLWIPPPHFFNVCRLVLWFLLALPAVKEYNVFLEGDSRDVFRKLGSFTWLAVAVLSSEVLLIVKMAHGEFTAPFPPTIVLAWSIAGSVFASFLAVWQMSIWIKRYRAQATPVYKKRQ